MRKREGKVYVTDEGNWILDCQTGPMNDPAAIANQIRNIVGVVEHGLFLSMATLAVLSDGEKIWEQDSSNPQRLPSGAA